MQCIKIYSYDLGLCWPFYLKHYFVRDDLQKKVTFEMEKVTFEKVFLGLEIPLNDEWIYLIDEFFFLRLKIRSYLQIAFIC